MTYFLPSATSSMISLVFPLGLPEGGRSPGADLRYDLKISLFDAAFGKEIEIEVEKKVRCDLCNGTGAQAGSAPQVCPHCQGRGQVNRSHGFFTISTTCPHCRGEGRVITNPCKSCRGSGLTKKA